MVVHLTRGGWWVWLQIHVVVVIAFCAVWVHYVADGHTSWQRAVECQDSCFVDLQPVAWLGRHMYNLAAVAALLSMLKVGAGLGTVPLRW